VLSVVIATAWLIGCVSCPTGQGDPAEKAAPPPGEEARLAGAEALCQQAIDLAGAQDVADTNALNQAIIESFRWACQLVPDNTNILDVAMFHLVDRSLFSEAYDLAQEYLARHPDNHALRYAAACCADADGKPEVAAQQCIRIYAAQPDNRMLVETLVRLYFSSRQDALAFDLIRANFERYPDTLSKALPVNWAIFFASQEKDFGRALQCANLALDLWTRPAERSPILTLIGECHMDQGNIADAADAFCAALGEDSANLMAVQRLGALCIQHPEITSRAEAAFDGFPRPGVAKLLLQAAILQATDKPAAIELLREAYGQSMIAGYFPCESFYLWQMMLLDAEKREDETVPILTEARAVHPDSPQIKNGLAYLWAERNENLNEANRLINEALLEEPNNPAYLDTKGWILFRLERPFDALQYLLKAAELQPDDPVILDHTGDVLSVLGYKTEASEFWSRSHRILPNPLIEKKLAQ